VDKSLCKQFLRWPTCSTARPNATRWRGRVVRFWERLTTSSCRIASRRNVSPWCRLQTLRGPRRFSHTKWGTIVKLFRLLRPCAYCRLRNHDDW